MPVRATGAVGVIAQHGVVDGICRWRYRQNVGCGSAQSVVSSPVASPGVDLGVLKKCPLAASWEGREME